MTSPKVIFLDWNKTLSNSIFWQQLRHPKHKLHHRLGEIETVLFDSSFNLVRPWMLGQLTSWEVCQSISKKLGINSELLHYELELSCRQMTIISIEAENLLRKIKQRGISLIIATDNMDTFTNFTYPTINSSSLFDGLINSYEIGCFKYDCNNNDLPFFKSYLDVNQLCYRDVLLIDDSLDKKGNFNRLGFEIVNIKEGGESLVEILKTYATTQPNFP